MLQTACLSHEQLRDFSLGRVSAEEEVRIAEHLDQCESCQQAAAECDRSADSLVAALRLGDDALSDDDVHCDAALARAKQLAGGPVDARHERTEPIRLREYELLRKLGEGGMGTVYLARHTRLDRIVALKILPPDRMRDSSAVARFEREMRAVGGLDHPAIVRATDAGDVDGTHFLVMEYVEGLDLSSLAERLGPIGLADACELVRQAALGLQHVHERGMVHRDIKPSNLMLTPRGEVKILDLGLALLQRGDGELHGITTVGRFMGTLDYMAPEQADDSHEVDIRADVYGLGATLYRLICGVPPFAGKEYRSPLKKLKALATEPVPPVRERRPEVPAGLAQVIERMLAKDPAARFGAPAEVADALAPFAAGSDLAQLQRSAESRQLAPQVDGPLAERVDDSRRDERRPAVTRHIRWLWVALLALVAFVSGAAIYVETDKGRLVIQSPDPGIEVLIRRGGKPVDDWELERGENRTTVRSGSYEIVLIGASDGLRLKDGRFTLTRGGEHVATIERRPKAAGVSDTDSTSPVEVKIISFVDLDASEAANIARQLMPEDRVQIATDWRTNSVLVRGRAEDLETLMAIFLRLDEAPTERSTTAESPQASRRAEDSHAASAGSAQSATSAYTPKRPIYGGRNPKTGLVELNPDWEGPVRRMLAAVTAIKISAPGKEVAQEIPPAVRGDQSQRLLGVITALAAYGPVSWNPEPEPVVVVSTDKGSAQIAEPLIRAALDRLSRPDRGERGDNRPERALPEHDPRSLRAQAENLRDTAVENLLSDLPFLFEPARRFWELSLSLQEEAELREASQQHAETAAEARATGEFARAESLKRKSEDLQAHAEAVAAERRAYRRELERVEESADEAQSLAAKIQILTEEGKKGEAAHLKTQLQSLLRQRDPDQFRILDLHERIIDARIRGNHELADRLEAERRRLLETLDERYPGTTREETEPAESPAGGGPVEGDRDLAAAIRRVNENVQTKYAEHNPRPLTLKRVREAIATTLKELEQSDDPELVAAVAPLQRILETGRLPEGVEFHDSAFIGTSPDQFIELKYVFYVPSPTRGRDAIRLIGLTDLQQVFKNESTNEFPRTDAAPPANEDEAVAPRNERELMQRLESAKAGEGQATILQLEQLVGLAEQRLERAKQAHSSRAISSVDLDAAHAELTEAQIKLVEATGTKQQVLDLLKKRVSQAEKRLEFIERLQKRGYASASEAADAKESLIHAQIRLASAQQSQG